MIINTGQRTDIPAFYAKWFINLVFIRMSLIFIEYIILKKWLS